MLTRCIAFFALVFPFRACAQVGDVSEAPNLKIRVSISLACSAIAKCCDLLYEIG